MKTVRIYSWNVNGLRAVYNKGAFTDFINQVEGADSIGADIICLQETKASEGQLPEDLKAVGAYHSYFSSAEKKGYSGVALYSKIELISLKHGFGIPEFDVEGRILIADYANFILFNIYFPNGGMSDERLDYKMRFYDAFLDIIDQLKAEGRHLIITGDVNTAHKEIDLANPKANEKVSGFLPQERAWMDKFISHGYVDTFRMFNQEPEQYTWWDLRTGARKRNIGWRLDYFFVDEGFQANVISSTILPQVTGSDHCPVRLEISY